MSLISVHHLTFGYEGSYDTILEDVSFSLDTNWKTGLIGRNGRGKTTFLKLLMGEYSYEGSITASTAFDYFPFLPPDLSATTLDVANAVCPDCEYWQETDTPSEPLPIVPDIAQNVYPKSLNAGNSGESGSLRRFTSPVSRHCDEKLASAPERPTFGCPGGQNMI